MNRASWLRPAAATHCVETFHPRIFETGVHVRNLPQLLLCGVLLSAYPHQLKVPKRAKVHTKRLSLSRLVATCEEEEEEEGRGRRLFTNEETRIRSSPVSGAREVTLA